MTVYQFRSDLLYTSAIKSILYCTVMDDEKIIPSLHEKAGS